MANGSIDLTGQPIPSGSMRSDELVLERFTRESEQLGKQAQPTADLARNIRMAGEEFGRMRIEISRMSDAMQSFSISFRENLGRVIDSIRSVPSTVQGRQQGGATTSIAGSAITGAVTAATIATITKQVQERVAPSMQKVLTAPTAIAPPPSSTITAEAPDRDRIAKALESTIIRGRKAAEDKDKESASAANAPAHTPFSMNTANLKELQEFTGIGKVTAEKIIAEREGPGGPYKGADVPGDRGLQDMLNRVKGVRADPSTLKAEIEQRETPQPAPPKRAELRAVIGEDVSRRTQQLEKRLADAITYGGMLADILRKAAEGVRGTDSVSTHMRLQAQYNEIFRLNTARIASMETLSSINNLTDPRKVGDKNREDYLAASRQEITTRGEKSKESAIKGRLDMSLIGGPEHQQALQRGSEESTVNNQRELMNEVEVVKEKLRVMKDPAGLKQLERERDLRRELKRLNEEQNKEARKRGLTDEGEGNEERQRRSIASIAQEIGNIGARVFAVGTGIASSMSAVANPVEWQTFKRSIEGVAASVGTVFSPVLLEMSSYLQQGADWFRNLDDATKSTIGRFAVFTIAGAGAIAMLSKFGLVAAGAIAGAYRFATALGAIALANPVTAIATTVVAVGGLAAAWNLAGDNARNAIRGMIGVGGVANAVNQAAQYQNLQRSLPQGIQNRIANAGPNPEDQIRVLREARAAQEREIQANRRAVATAGGREAEQQELERRYAEQALPRAQQIFERLQAGRRPPPGERPPPGGFPPPNPADIIADRRSAAIQAAQDARNYGGAVPQAGVIANVTDRLQQGLQGRGVGGVTISPALQRAQDALNSSTGVLNTINQMMRVISPDGAGGPRLSLKGLLPSPQMFQDFAQVGEQLTLKSLERQGEQDVLLAVQNIESIAKAIGISLEVIATRVDASDMVRMMGGMSRGR